MKKLFIVFVLSAAFFSCEKEKTEELTLARFDPIDHCDQMDACMKIAYGASYGGKVQAEYALCIKQMKKYNDASDTIGQLKLAAWAADCRGIGPCGYHYCMLQHSTANTMGKRMQAEIENPQKDDPDAGVRDVK